MNVPEDDALMEASGIVYLPEGQLYELNIVATGEVRDKDGNLISPATAEGKRIVTEAEALAIMQAMETGD